jgi:hypothetical protein
MTANSMVIWAWVPLFFTLEPGGSYRNLAGLAVWLLVMPSTLVYGIVLAFVRTKHHLLKVGAVILNLTPIPISLLLVKLLAITGHMPAP